jgi:hypothetical protein
VSDADPLLDRLNRAVGVATGDDDRAATFARGLILGALVGAAIAGSTIWQRRRARIPPPTRSVAVPDESTTADTSRADPTPRRG